MQNMYNKKLDGINALKGIACIVVVFLHIPFPGIVGKLIGFEFNFSVPVFFMISGYFAFKKQNRRWVLSKAFYIAKLTLVTELLYGIWYLFADCFVNRTVSVSEFVVSLSWIRHPLRTVLCGTMFNGTLWYLYAAGWAWLIYYFIIRKDLLNGRNIYILIPVLSSVQIFGKLYVQNHFNIAELIYLFRNAIVFALPMMLLGSFIGKNQDTIMRKLSPWKSCSLIIAGGGRISVIEYISSHLFFKVNGMDFHVSTVVVVVGLFTLSLNYANAKHKCILCFIGEKLSVWIYLTHIFVAAVIELVAVKCGVSGSILYEWTKPVLTVLGAGFCGLAINWFIVNDVPSIRSCFSEDLKNE